MTPLARLAVGCGLAVVLLAACSSGSGSDPGDAEPSASSGSPSHSPSPSATANPTASATSTGGRDSDVTELVVPPAAPVMPEAWRERFVVAYGPDKTLLGTAPGGDSGSLDIGPEYGAPGPDGTWWFLDAAKARVAHYDVDGRYLGQVRISRRLLVGGRYFQWQLPHVLADATLVAARQGPDRTWLLRVRGRAVDEVPVDGTFSPTYDDGTRLYGFGDGGIPVVVDPADGSLKATKAYRTPSGTPFRIAVTGRGLRIRLPDSATSKALPVTTTSGARAHIGLQVRAGADDVLHLYLTGIGEDDESVQLVGATMVTPSGQVAEVEALVNPFTEADPGSPAQLQLAPGSSTPMLVYVGTDGVHVFERTG